MPGPLPGSTSQYWPVLVRRIEPDYVTCTDKTITRDKPRELSKASNYRVYVWVCVYRWYIFIHLYFSLYIVYLHFSRKMKSDTHVAMTRSRVKINNKREAIEQCGGWNGQKLFRIPLTNDPSNTIEREREMKKANINMPTRRNTPKGLQAYLTCLFFFCMCSFFDHASCLPFRLSYICAERKGRKV